MILHEDYLHGGDIYRNRIRLDFSVNVNPLGTPEPVRVAVRNSADLMENYPDPCCGELRRKLADSLQTDPERILLGNSAGELIYQLTAALKPAKALLPVPSFSDYEAALSAEGTVVTFFPLRREEGFRLTERICEAVTEETGLLMLGSPNNPTGRLIPRDLLLKIRERCRETGTWLFLDECFGELTDEGTPSLADILKPDDKVFLLRAFTKTYAMPGVRLGYAVCPDRTMMDRISRLSQAWNVSLPAQQAGLAALNCGEWVKEARTVIRNEKARLIPGLERLGFTVYPGDANYLLFSGMPGLYDKLLEQGILIRSCANYRGLRDGDYRIAVRKREENEVLLQALREVLHASDRN